MIRTLRYLIAYAACLLIYAIGCSIRARMSAPVLGFDRAGGPYNGHPARKRQRPGAAATAGITGAKDGNGALHSSAGAA